MFGIGLSRNIEGRYAQIAEAVNEAGEKGSVVVAVDIASGINADNGQIMGVAVKADYTVTFGYKKTGIMFIREQHTVVVWRLLMQDLFLKMCYIIKWMALAEHSHIRMTI